MGFYQEIRRLHGEETVVQMKQLCNSNRKLAHYDCHKRFLTRCKRSKVFPHHIQQTSKCTDHLRVENTPFTDKSNRILYKFKRSLLNLEIEFSHWKATKIQHNMNNLKLTLHNSLTEVEFNTFIQKQNIFYENESKKVKGKQLKKFRMLIASKNTLGDIDVNPHEVNPKWLINFTNIDIPPNVKKLISFGPRFNLPYSFHNLPLDQLIIDCEFILSSIGDEETKIQTRNCVINILTNFLYRSQWVNRSIDSRNVLKICNETTQFLKTNNNLMLTNADKGNTTVLLDKSEYSQKAYALLNDQNTYSKLSKDPTVTVQNKLNKIIDNFQKRKVISSDEGKFLKCNNGVPPKMYFLPKIHKNNVPLRPIVSFIGSPLYNLTKFLSELLTKMYTKDARHVRNSFEFSEDIRGRTVPDDYILVSLDAISLFTNIPLDLVIDIIRKKWNLLRDIFGGSLDEFLTLFTFCIDNNYFQFENQFYKQTYGLGMGNCMSPICSDLVMYELQEHCIGSLPFSLPFFNRYVDDIITSIPKQKTKDILSTFNNFHERLQFTIEVEVNNSLPFLDVLVIRQENGSLLTNWYHKPTFSERFLNFQSEHPLSQKINIIQNLVHRALSLSSPQFAEKNLTYIQHILTQQNNYPISLTKKIIHNIKNRSEQQQSQLQHQQQQQTLPNQTTIIPKYYKIPYINQLSHQIGKAIMDKNSNIRVTSKSENNLYNRIFTRLKSTTPLNMQSNVIYKIPCVSCNRCYIGQTGRYMKQRIYEHKNDCKNYLTKQNPTALVEHKINTGHSFDFENVSIIGRQNNYRKRLLHEMIAIKKEKRSVNKRTDIENLNTAYFNIIDRMNAH